DLGLAVVWEVDGEGRHTARWEVPVSAALGRYRFAITANRYRLVSEPFTVSRSTALGLTDAPTRRGVAVRITYPVAVPEEDLTYRPRHARGGRVAFIVAGRKVVVRSRQASKFAVANRGAQVQVPRSAATDRWGNRNGRALILGGP
nr:hypothetical protein [Actinomycetota bacterium]